MSFFHSLLTIGFDSDYQAYLAKIDSEGEVRPPQNIQVAQINFIKSLKAAGLWTRMKTGYFFHAGSRGVARINIKNPATYEMTANNVNALQPLFIQGVGQRGGGGTVQGYYDQPFKSNEYAGIQTDLTIIQYMPNEPFGSEYAYNAYSHGMDVNSAAGTDNYIGLIPFHSASQGFRARAASPVAFTNTTHKGLYVQTYDGTNSVIYKDGVKTSAAASPAAPNNSINRLIFSTNNDGAATTTYNRLIAADFLFDRFNDTDESTFRGIWDTFRTTVNLDFQYVAEYASHCWFTRNKTAYDASTNKSWIGQCHNDGFNTSNLGYTQYIFEIDNDTNALSKFKLGTVTEQDDHNEPSILRRASDSKLFVVYSEHGGTVLRYRLSTNANDASAWGSESTVDPAGGGTHKYTYPSAFEATNGDIYIFFRDQIISGSVVTQRGWSYVKSTDGGATFSGYARITGVTYSALAQDPNDKDKIHFIVTWHPDDTVVADNWVMHGYWDCGTNTFHKSDGTDITANIPVTQAHMTIIDTCLIANDEDCWLEDIVVDGSGNPRVLYTKIPDMPTALLKDEYYSEWTGSAWTTPHLLQRSATHYMETELLATNLQSIWYAPCGSFDRANVDRIISSIETPGHFGDVCEIWELHRVSASSFTRVQRTFDSEKDQWRPFMIEAPTNNAFWLNKIYYDHWLDEYFQTLILKTFL